MVVALKILQNLVVVPFQLFEPGLELQLSLPHLNQANVFCYVLIAVEMIGCCWHYYYCYYWIRTLEEVPKSLA